MLEDPIESILAFASILVYGPLSTPIPVFTGRERVIFGIDLMNMRRSIDNMWNVLIWTVLKPQRNSSELL
jgi:hypothetical protein